MALNHDEACVPCCAKMWHEFRPIQMNHVLQIHSVTRASHAKVQRSFQDTCQPHPERIKTQCAFILVYYTNNKVKQQICWTKYGTAISHRVADVGSSAPHIIFCRLCNSGGPKLERLPEIECRLFSNHQQPIKQDIMGLLYRRQCRNNQRMLNNQIKWTSIQ